MFLLGKKVVTTLAVVLGLAGWSSPLFGQQEFFSPVSIQKQVVASNKHDFINIIHGPGQVKFEMPLAPGLQARGLSYCPVFRMHPSQKTMANITGAGSWHSDWYIGLQEWVLVGGMDSSTGVNDLWFNNEGATTIYSYPTSGGPPTTILCQNFNQDPSSLHLIDPGYMTSHYDDGGMKVIVLPTGESISVACSQQALEVNSASYMPLLEKFGIQGLSLSPMKSFKADPEVVIIPLTNEDGSTPVVVDGEGLTYKTAGRYVVVKSDTAYVFEYRGPFDVSMMAPEYFEGDMVTPLRTYFKVGYYSLSKMHNRFGDRIDFTYDNNDFDYKATLYAGGQDLGDSISVNLTTIPQQSSIPDMGSPFYARADYDSIPVSKKISVKQSGTTGVVASYSIIGAFSTGRWDRDVPQKWAPVGYTMRRAIQPVSITEDQSGFKVEFSYKWETGHLAYAQGLNVAAVCIESITFNENEIFNFTYQPIGFYSESPLSGWDGLAWGITSMEHSNFISGESRITSYERLLPTSEPYSTNPSSYRRWINKESYEAETLPDGRVIVRRFMPPNTPLTVDTHSMNIDDHQLAYFNLFLKGALFEERTYSAEADWKSNLTSADPTVLSMKFMDGWSPKSWVDISSKPYGADTNCDGVPGWMIYRTLIPTRTTEWSRNTKVAVVTRQGDWESASAQWRENSKTYFQAVESPWTTFSPEVGLPYESLPSNPASGVSRKNKTVYRPVDEWLLFGDWTEKSYLENGVDRLPTQKRTSNHSTGVTLTEESVGTGSELVRKVFTYTDSGDASPSSISVKSNGFYLLDGLVGVDLGYDSYGRLNSVQKFGAEYKSTRTFTPNGQVDSITDINSLTTSYQWDSLQRLTSVTPPTPLFGSTISYDSDFMGMQITTGSQVQKYRFNVFGEQVREVRKFSESDFANRKSGYDASGRKIWQTVWQTGEGEDAGWDGAAPAGIPVAKWSFDDWDRVIGMENANKEEKQFEYSGLTKKITVAPNSLAISSTQTFDALGRLVSVSDPTGKLETQYSYDSADRLVLAKQTSTKGTQSRSWEFNSLGWQSATVQPESGRTEFSNFDVLGKPNLTIYGAGSTGPRSVTSEHDTQGRLIKISNSTTGFFQTLTYDEVGHGLAHGKLTTSQDGEEAPVIRSFVYDQLDGRLGSLTSQIPGLPYPLYQLFSYDNYGTRVGSNIHGNGVVTPHDPISGLPTMLKYKGQDLVEPSYFKDSQGLEGLAWFHLGAKNGVEHHFTYGLDQIQLATSIFKYKNLDGTSATPSWSMTYDDAGRLETDGEDLYAYDALHRLKQAVIRRPDGSALTQNFTYDPFGNMLSKVLSGNTSGVTAGFVFSEAALAPKNQIPSATTLAVYTPQGNLDQVLTEPGGAALAMTYDDVGRMLTLYNSKTGITERYRYTVDGLRTLIEDWNGTVLQRMRINLYNDQRQLVSQWVME